MRTRMFLVTALLSVLVFSVAIQAEEFSPNQTEQSSTLPNDSSANEDLTCKDVCVQDGTDPDECEMECNSFAALMKKGKSVACR